MAEQLKAARRAVNYSQAELARYAGISERMVGLIETEQLKQPPRAATVVRLALATGANPRDWLQIVEREMSDKDLASLREAVRMKTAPEEIEPAGKIKEDIRKETERRFEEIIRTVDDLRSHMRDFKQPELIEEDMKRLIYQYIKEFDPPEKIRTEIESEFEQRLRREFSTLEPADKLRRDLISYVDSRVSELRTLLADVNERVSQVAGWQRDLAKRIDATTDTSASRSGVKTGRKI